MKPWVSIFFMYCCAAASAQHTFKAKVIDESTWEPLVGAQAFVINEVRAIADDNGILLISSLPDGEFEIEFHALGYEVKRETFTFPLPNPHYVFTIGMTPDSKKLKEVTVSATRSTRVIADIPTRIEVISSEELEARTNVRPSDIRMLLYNSTGIQMQQTSVTSYNSSIRIHGLDGRYTQLLRDGFPVYNGFASGLSLLQITPLDLQQVEVVKGSSSTLYGGGAISGLVNLVSKTPDEKEISFMVNGTSTSGLDISAFYAQRFDRIGTTFFASRNSHWAYDPAGISLSAIPKFERYTFNPGLYFYFSDKTLLKITLNSMFEERLGGDTKYIRGEPDSVHSFFEKNSTDRVSSQMTLQHRISEKSSFIIKNSLVFFNRSINMPDYHFSGGQFSSFSEISWQRKTSKTEWILGLNEWSENFSEKNSEPASARDYKNHTFGAFAQNTWNLTRWFTVETGLRADYQSDYGFFVLPRLSTLFKISSKLTARAGAGMGYRNPSIFTDEAERLHFRNVLPVDVKKLDAERSAGGNFDINYKTPAFKRKGSFSINQLVFFTRIYQPVTLVEADSAIYEFALRDGYYDSKGTETNIRIKYGPYIWLAGYTFADVKQRFEGATAQFPLSARHRANAIFIYEVNTNFRIGFEAAYTGSMRLSDQTKTDGYVICNIMFEKMWKHVTVFANCENMLNVRQTKYERIYTGTVTNPSFNEIYAPMDGVMANIGIKVRL